MSPTCQLVIAVSIKTTRTRCAFQLAVLNPEKLRWIARVSSISSGLVSWKLENTFHLTLLHLGGVDEFVAEIAACRSTGKDVDAERAALVLFANKLAARETKSITVNVRKAEFWKSDGRDFCVLLVDPSSELIGLRKKILLSLCDFLKSRGITNPADFIINSPTMAFRPIWRPHITLASRRAASRGSFPLKSNLTGSGYQFTLKYLRPCSRGWLRYDNRLRNKLEAYPRPASNVSRLGV